MSANSKSLASPWEKIKNTLRAREKSCVVYGTGDMARAFLKILGKDGIRGELGKIYNVKYFVIIMDSDRETVEVYNKHFKEMQKGRIIVMLKDAKGFTPENANTRVISISDITAVMYWRDYPAKPSEKVGIIGDDSLVQAILRQGLCLNIFSTAQHIEYHIWNENATEYQGISQITMDRVHIHEKSHSEEISTLIGMDRLILCLKNGENTTLLNRIMREKDCPTIYIYDENKGEYPVNPKPLVITFGENESFLKRQVILEEETIKEAKELNSHYSRLFNGPQWNDLSRFKRLSSISSAAYFPVLRQLYRAGIGLETLSELEHIRWSRFHLLNGWTYGAKRDNEKKIHNCLVPYAHLTEEEKQKDRNNVRLALSELLDGEYDG